MNARVWQTHVTHLQTGRDGGTFEYGFNISTYLDMSFPVEFQTSISFYMARDSYADSISTFPLLYHFVVRFEQRRWWLTYGPLVRFIIE